MVEQEDSFELTVTYVLFCNDDNGYAVVKGTRKNKEEVTVVGTLGHLTEGERIRVRGNWVAHPSYGRQLKVLAFMPVLPTSADGIEKFLGSGAISGLGPAISKRIVERFGDDTLEVITRHSARLREVSGIGKKRAEQIAASLKARAGDMEVFSFLQGLGLGPALSRAVIRVHGPDAVRIAREDPYKLVATVQGLGFKTADQLGRAAGIAFDDPRRARGAVLHVLDLAADDGHVYLPVSVLARRAESLQVPSEVAIAAVESLCQEDLLVRDVDDVYAPELYQAECRIADDLRERANANVSSNAAAWDGAHDASLNDTQREAVERALSEKLLVITGGPGTGKTTTVRSIVKAHEALGRRIILAAPTGRAAKRLEEATGHAATTIHRLLEWNPASGGFARTAELPLDAETLLVDECSMIDLRLASSLFDAVPASTHLVLVGDVDQLPPVGVGQLLRDVIASKVAPVVRFSEVFRQAQDSDIVRAAHAILSEASLETSEAGAEPSGSFHIISESDAERIQARIATFVRRAAKACDIEPYEVQVMTPSRRGPLGTEALNALLQRALNPQANEDASTNAIVVGDKVMQLRNDYERDVFNGDIGFVTRIQGGSTFVRFDEREVQYDREALNNLSLAYACTVHKMQGSETGAAILVLHPSHHVLLSRALLYTAITRARQLAVLVADAQTIARTRRNTAPASTYSKLSARLAQTYDASMGGRDDPRHRS